MLICTLRECAGMKRDITTISELPRNPDAFIIYEWELGNERTITFAGQDTICHTDRYESQIGWKSAISEFLCAIPRIAKILKFPPNLKLCTLFISHNHKLITLCSPKIQEEARLRHPLPPLSSTFGSRGNHEEKTMLHLRFLPGQWTKTHEGKSYIANLTNSS